MPIAEAFTPVVPTGNPTTGFSVTIPAGAAAGVILEISVTSRDSVNPALGPTISDNDSGGNAWAIVRQSADGKATTWWKRATSGTAGKSITIASALGSCSGVLKGWTNCAASGTPQTDVAEEANASGNETHAGFTPSQADSMVRAVIYNYGNDNAVTSLSFATLGATTMTEKLSTGGSDCACASGHKLQAGAAAATGDLTWAQTNGATYSHVWALIPLEEHSGSAALSSGGGITPAVETQRNVAPVLASGGGVTPVIATARNAASTLASGGEITPAITTQRNVTLTLSGGGSAAPAIATQRNAAPVLASGGDITITGEASGGAEEHSGSVALSSGGGIGLAIGTARTLAALLTAGGGASLANSTARALAAILTSGGGIQIVPLGAKSAIVSLSGGGSVLVSAATARAIAVALVSGGGITVVTEESGDRSGDVLLSCGGGINISAQIAFPSVREVIPYGQSGAVPGASPNAVVSVGGFGPPTVGDG